MIRAQYQMRTKIGIQVHHAHQLRKYYTKVIKYWEIEAIFDNGFGFDEDFWREQCIFYYTRFLVSINYYLFLKYSLGYYILYVCYTLKSWPSSIWGFWSSNECQYHSKRCAMRHKILLISVFAIIAINGLASTFVFYPALTQPRLSQGYFADMEEEEELKDQVKNFNDQYIEIFKRLCEKYVFINILYIFGVL